MERCRLEEVDLDFERPFDRSRFAGEVDRRPRRSFEADRTLLFEPSLVPRLFRSFFFLVLDLEVSLLPLLLVEALAVDLDREECRVFDFDLAGCSFFFLSDRDADLERLFFLVSSERDLDLDRSSFLFLPSGERDLERVDRDRLPMSSILGSPTSLMTVS